jgi:hypothetical protein
MYTFTLLFIYMTFYMVTFLSLHEYLQVPESIVVFLSVFVTPFNNENPSPIIFMYLGP